MRIYATCMLVLFSALQATAQPNQGTWMILSNRAGASIQYPPSVFPVDSTETGSDRLLYETVDGRGRLELFSLRNQRNETPPQFMRRVTNEGETFTYGA